MLEEEIKAFFKNKMPFLHIGKESFGYNYKTIDKSILKEIAFNEPKTEADYMQFRAMIKQMLAQGEAFYLLTYYDIRECFSHYRQGYRLVPGVYDWLGALEGWEDYYLHYYEFSKKDFDVTLFFKFLEEHSSESFMLVDITNRKALDGSWNYGLTILANSAKELQAYLPSILTNE